MQYNIYNCNSIFTTKPGVYTTVLLFSQLIFSE